MTHLGPRPRAGAASRRRRRVVAASRARHLADVAAVTGGRRGRARPACVCGGDGPGRPIRVSGRRHRGRGGAGGCAGCAGRGVVWGDDARLAAAACRGGWDLSRAARLVLQLLVPRGERRRRPSRLPPAMASCSCPRPRSTPRSSPHDGPHQAGQSASVAICVTDCAARRGARARQARGRSVAVCRAALAFASRAFAAAIPAYPAEAAVALGNSVQATELDDRCGAPSTHAWRRLACSNNPT